MTAYYLLFVISTSYTMANFNASPSLAGLVAGFMILGCLAGRFVCGRLVDSVGFQKVMFSGLVIYLVGLGLYLLAHNLFFLLILRFVSGIGVGCIGTVTATLIARIVPMQRVGEGISYFTLSTILALAAGPFLGIFLMQLFSFTYLFLLCLGFGIVSFIIAIFVKFPDHVTATASVSKCLTLGAFLEFKVMPISIVIFLACFCYGNVQAFLSNHASNLGLENIASFYFFVYAGIVFITRPFTGKIIDGRGENPVAYPALGLMALSLLLLAKTDSSWMLLLSAVMLGMGFGNFQSLVQVICIKLATRHRMAQATSTFFIFMDLGIGIGPYVLGLLVPSSGYAGLYTTTSLLTVAAMPAYYLLHGKKVIR